MAILITGGAGYIGSHTARLLKDKGYDVVVYDNLSTGHRQAVQGLPLVVGDISDCELLKRTLETYRISGVIHFASSSLVGESMLKPRRYYKNNVCGTLSLLKIMLEKNIRNIIFSSSAAVYGQADSFSITEEYELKPVSVYGRTKVMTEAIMEDYRQAYGLNYISLRYFNACGADETGKWGEDHDPETHLIPLVLKTALGQRKEISIFGEDYPTKDGTCIRDYVHVHDLARAHLLAMEYLQEGNEPDTFNLGNCRGFSVQEVIQIAEEVAGKTIPRKAAPRRTGDPAILVANADKAGKILGWKPQYTELKDILRTAWNWHCNNPFGYNCKKK